MPNPLPLPISEQTVSSGSRLFSPAPRAGVLGGKQGGVFLSMLCCGYGGKVLLREPVVALDVEL